MLLALLACVPLFYLWHYTRRSNPWPRRFLAGIGWLAGVRVQVRGAPATHNALLLSNHVSWLDIPLVAGASGSAFVAHSGLADDPLLSRLCAMNRTVYVHRGDRGRVADQVRDVRKALAHGGVLTIFPEGTTGDGMGLMPFKSALLSALEPPLVGVVVQPVWIDYGADAAEIAWAGDEPGPANVLRVLARSQALPVTLHFLAPFDPGIAGERKAIAAEARRRIEQAMAGATT
ncbi:MAG: lysophospholipid acyltransferase family protein [Novosphingobium sp.]